MNQTWDVLQANLFYYCENLLIICRDCSVIRNLSYAIEFHRDGDLNEMIEFLIFLLLLVI